MKAKGTKPKKAKTPPVLNFYPRPGHAVTKLGTVVSGARQKYLGRKYEPKPDGGFELVATGEVITIIEDSPAGRQIKKEVRRDNCLIPADEETAARCGVPYEVAVFDEDEQEWVTESRLKALEDQQTSIGE